MNSILVLPRFPLLDTGTGQRSLLFLEAAQKLGPTHVVLLEGKEQGYDPVVLPGAASISVIHSDLVSPAGRWRQLMLGVVRIVIPFRAYRVDSALNARLGDLIGKAEARAVIFRYARTYCVSGIVRNHNAGVDVFVDVDDRDDQKYGTRLQRLFGRWFVEGAIGKNRLTALAVLLRQRLEEATLVWFVAAEDSWRLEKAAVRILGNVPFQTTRQKDVLPPSQSQNLLFVGIFSHIPNRDGVRWFLDDCWPELHTRFPQAHFRIVGRGDWASLAANYKNLGNVEFVGPVKDLDQEYTSARLCVCPVREGGGSKIKVVEAAAFRRPVVATPHALRGFGDDVYKHANSAGTAADFIEACALFLSDGSLADKTGAAFQDWQAQQFSHEAAVGRIAADIWGSLQRRAGECDEAETISGASKS